jgi:hypothetical protein
MGIACETPNRGQEAVCRLYHLSLTKRNLKVVPSQTYSLDWEPDNVSDVHIITSS